MHDRETAARKRELKRRTRDPLDAWALEYIELLEERVAIMSEGRRFIDGDKLAREFFLLSASAGGMTGVKMLSLCEKAAEEAMV